MRQLPPVVLQRRVAGQRIRRRESHPLESVHRKEEVRDPQWSQGQYLFSQGEQKHRCVATFAISSQLTLSDVFLRPDDAG